MRRFQSISLCVVGLGVAVGCGVEPLDLGEDDTVPLVVQDAFTESCATSASCHVSGGQYPDLSNAAASAAIIDGGSNQSSLPLVTIGDVEQSYLGVKLLPSRLDENMGGLMPQTASAGGNDEQNVALILGWIAGAPFEGDGDGDGDGDLTGSFVDDVWPVMEMSCSCHLSEASPGNGNLSLQEDNAYDNIVGQPSPTADMDLVTAEDLDESYLWKKVDGTFDDVTGSVGGLMPLGGELSDADKLAISNWIEMGAMP